MSKKTKIAKPIDDKVKIARLINSMSDDKLMEMACEIVDLNSPNLDSYPSVKRLLRNWAKGLGSIE